MRIRWRFFTIPILWMSLIGSAAGDSPLPDDAHADKVIVLKSQRELQLIREGKVLKRYSIALGSSPAGPKEREGDGKTPEGIYTILGRNAGSAYHFSLRISYPNPNDLARAKKLKVKPGGDIFIHGLPNGYGWLGKGHRLKDWTLGCIAVTNEEIEEIWRAVPNGTTVEIRP